MENTNKQLTMTCRNDVGDETEMKLTLPQSAVKKFEDMGCEAPYNMTAIKDDEGKWRVEIRTKDGKTFNEQVEDAATETPNTEEGAMTLIEQIKRYICSYNSEPEPEMTDGEQRCCLCEKMFVGWGHNPKPLPFARVAKGSGFTSHRCCDECNTHLVIPVRRKFISVGKFKLGCDDVRKVIITKVDFGEEKAFYILKTKETIIPYFYISPETNLPIERTCLANAEGFEDISAAPMPLSQIHRFAKNLDTKIQQMREQNREQEERRKAKKEAEKAKEERRKIKEAQRQEEEAERRRVENEMIAKRREESARLEAEYNAAKQREFEERLKALERREAERKEEERREKEQKAAEAAERAAAKRAEKEAERLAKYAPKSKK